MSDKLQTNKNELLNRPGIVKLSFKSVCQAEILRDIRKLEDSKYRNKTSK